MYLSSADHELAVQAIQRSGNPIRFVVQSLQHMVSIEDNYVECLSGCYGPLNAPKNTTTNLLGGPDIGCSFFVCCQKLKNNILI